MKSSSILQVGFGDVHFTLQAEVDHVYEMLFYRVFGLSFLAAIIEAIQTYIRFRNGVSKVTMPINNLGAGFFLIIF